MTLKKVFVEEEDIGCVFVCLASSGVKMGEKLSPEIFPKSPMPTEKPKLLISNFKKTL